MDVLIIGKAERESIKKLIKYAEDNPLTQEYLEKHDEPPAKESGMTHSNPESMEVGAKYTVEFPGGVNVTYTHEHQPLAECRHMSISSMAKYPTIGVVEMMMREFGFVNKSIKDIAGWMEDLGDDRIAINLLEPLDGNMNRLKKQ